MTTDRTSTWVDEVAHWLIHRAAQHAPGELSERLAEEWRADLGGRRPGLARLRFALGCSWATRVIALDRSRAALSASAGGQGSTIGYFEPDTLFLSRRYATFLLVVGLHGAVRSHHGHHHHLSQDYRDAPESLRGAARAAPVAAAACAAKRADPDRDAGPR